MSLFLLFPLQLSLPPYIVFSTLLSLPPQEPTHFDADAALIQEDMEVMSDFERHLPAWNQSPAWLWEISPPHRAAGLT